MKTLYTCMCDSLEHSFVVIADEEDLWISVHLSPLPFHRRLKHALLYLLGRRSRWGDFDEILISPTDALALGDQLTEWARGDKAGFDTNDAY